MAKIGATLLAVNIKNTAGVKFCPAGILPLRGCHGAKNGATLLVVNRKNTAGVMICPAGILPSWGRHG